MKDHNQVYDVCEISIVVPVYNEEEILESTMIRLRSVLDSMRCGYEVLIVDDGSIDSTREIVGAISQNWIQVQSINLLTNFGHMAAITAGLEASKGRFVVSIDADMQDPPELIPLMHRRAVENSVDVVYGIRRDRSTDSMFKRTSAAFYYSFIRRLAKVDLPFNSGEFRLMSRKVVDLLNSLPESQKIYRLLVPFYGFSFSTVEYKREKREAGKSHYSFSKMVRLALDSVTAFSSAPLKVATYAGIFGFIAFFALSTYSLISFSSGKTVPGWASLMLVSVFFGSMQLLSLGLIGEYLTRLYQQSQNRPAYVIDPDKK